MITDLGELKKLLTLCRKQGITEISLNGVHVKFGDLPENDSQLESKQNEVPSDNPYASFPDGQLTATQLAYYSAGGSPENDPELEVAQ